MTNPTLPVDPRRINLLSDTVLYAEAVAFVAEHPMPKQSQLMGLQQFSRTWDELKDYINHQRGRDWGRDTTTPLFYDALRDYLGTGGGKKPASLFQRITDAFGLVAAEGLTKQQQRDATEAWAGALAAAFITHLVCAALVVPKGRDARGDA